MIEPDTSQTDNILFKDIESQLGVSGTSIKNWIKTGYLEQTSKNTASVSSFYDFKNKVAGGEKLNSRANKTLKDPHDHTKLQDKYSRLINKDKDSDYDLGVMYEQELSDSHRNKEGVYYTPLNIAERFFRYLPKDCSNLTFCDPCCGSGNFIVSALECGILPENIYGYDVDLVAVEVTKKRIFKHSGYKTTNIKVTDFLEHSLDKSNKECFDIIFTNPPWGKKITKKQKDIYATALNAGKSVDTSSLFFFSCLTKLTDCGYLGFLLQDAFFNISCYEDARIKALELHVLSVIDFGKPFKGLLTKAKGIVIKNTKPKKNNIVECSGVTTIHNRLQGSFLLNPKSILNSNSSQEESEAISHLFSLPHTTLSGQAKWGLGIVTGNNKKFIKNKKTKGYIPIYKGTDIKNGEIGSPSSYIPDDMTLYHQVAPIDLYKADEKLIYKFISSKLVSFCDQEQRYILNSACMLIPNKDFPISQTQLSQILNSKAINWVFKTMFDTHKVLRSDIETLPIHSEYFNYNSVFDNQSFNDYLNLEEAEDGAFRIKR